MKKRESVRNVVGEVGEGGRVGERRCVSVGTYKYEYKIRPILTLSDTHVIADKMLMHK